MSQQHLSAPASGAITAESARRLVAAGIIRRTGGRTLRITATQAGVTGSIRTAGAR